MSNSNQPKKEIESIEILPENYPSYDISFKVIVIGDTGVGKSCISLRATKSVFNEQYMATVGFEYCTFITRLNGEVLKLQIWDTCGQEMYRSLVSNFYKSSALAIVVYAINDRKSFEDIDEWIDGVRKNSSSDIILFLVGNKFDVDEEERKVTYEEGEELKNKLGFSYFCEISAKTGFNTKEIFIEAIKQLYTRYKEVMNLSSNLDSKNNSKCTYSIRRGSVLSSKNKTNKKDKCC